MKFEKVIYLTARQKTLHNGSIWVPLRKKGRSILHVEMERYLLSAPEISQLLRFMH